MDRTKTIRGHGSHRGMGFTDVSNRLQNVIRADKKFVAVGTLLLLAGWIPPMASMGGGSCLDCRGLPAYLRQPSSLLSSTRKSLRMGSTRIDRRSEQK